MRPETKKHLVPCPHCGRDILDHMDCCPFCRGQVRPKGPEFSRFKGPLSVLLWLLAAGCLIWTLFLKNR